MNIIRTTFKTEQIMLKNFKKITKSRKTKIPYAFSICKLQVSRDFKTYSKLWKYGIYININIETELKIETKNKKCL